MKSGGSFIIRDLKGQKLLIVRDEAKFAEFLKSEKEKQNATRGEKEGGVPAGNGVGGTESAPVASGVGEVAGQGAGEKGGEGGAGFRADSGAGSGGVDETTAWLTSIGMGEEDARKATEEYREAQKSENPVKAIRAFRKDVLPAFAGQATKLIQSGKLNDAEKERLRSVHRTMRMALRQDDEVEGDGIVEEEEKAPAEKFERSSASTLEDALLERYPEKDGKPGVLELFRAGIANSRGKGKPVSDEDVREELRKTFGGMISAAQTYLESLGVDKSVYLPAERQKEKDSGILFSSAANVLVKENKEGVPLILRYDPNNTSDDGKTALPSSYFHNWNRNVAREIIKESGIKFERHIRYGVTKGGDIVASPKGRAEQKAFKDAGGKIKIVLPPNKNTEQSLLDAGGEWIDYYVRTVSGDAAAGDEGVQDGDVVEGKFDKTAGGVSGLSGRTEERPYFEIVEGILDGYEGGYDEKRHDTDQDYRAKLWDLIMGQEGFENAAGIVLDRIIERFPARRSLSLKHDSDAGARITRRQAAILRKYRAGLSRSEAQAGQRNRRNGFALPERIHQGGFGRRGLGAG